MRVTTFACLLVLACGCSSSSGSNDASGGANGAGGPGGGGEGGSGSEEQGGGGQGADAGRPRKVCTGFASAPSSWSVPDPAFNRVNATYGQWLTMDLDGDGKVDLVRANDPANDGKPFGAASGKPYWQMFKGNGTGFDQTPTAWSVPDVLFNRVNALYGQWLTMDLDGDGKLDLVRASDPNDDGKPFGAAGGKPYWQFFKGRASGFAATPSQWSVPDVLFNRVNALYGQWLTMDLDGDGCVDLVRANDPDNDGKAFAGPSWQRFAAQ